MACTYGVDISSIWARSIAWGIGIVQTLDERKLDLYLGFRSYGLTDNLATTYQNVQAIEFETRVKF